MQKDKNASKNSVEKDALIMALRLLGEDENTFSPEVREVMSRWKSRARAELKRKALMLC